MKIFSVPLKSASCGQIVTHLAFKTSIVTASISLAVCSAYAAEAVVIKAKGRQAIVQFPPDFVPRAGARILVGPATEGLSKEQIDAESGGSRPHLIAISMNLTSLTTSTTAASSTASTNSTNFGISGLYGWNFETIEVGPLLSFAYSGSTGSSSTSFSGGAFLDYDFLPNLPTTNLVAGLGAQLFAGRSSASNASSSSSLACLEAGSSNGFALAIRQRCAWMRWVITNALPVRSRPPRPAS